ncbi:hypothetical protein HYW42_04530 [Candidatus Daviesbacteria bacterium]|nr:hypothetical protein [Candidatus Daviesbacteria bacterium]
MASTEHSSEISASLMVAQQEPIPNIRRQNKIVASIVRGNPRLVLLDKVDVTTDEKDKYHQGLVSGSIGDKDLRQLLAVIPTPVDAQSDRENPVAVFDRFKGEDADHRHLRRVVSFATRRGDITQENQLVPRDIYRVARDYPTALEFEKMSQRFLKTIEQANKPQDREKVKSEYAKSIDEAATVIYGSQWVYLKQARILQKEGKKDTKTPSGSPNSGRVLDRVLENELARMGNEARERGFNFDDKTLMRFREAEKDVRQRYPRLMHLREPQPVRNIRTQADPFGMDSSVFASAENAIRHLLGEGFNHSRHAEGALIAALGGSRYATEHQRGGSIKELLSALSLQAPEIRFRETNSLADILQNVEEGAVAILPINDCTIGPRGVETGRIGFILPGRRVRRTSDGNLEVQIVDPSIGRAVYKSVQDIIRYYGLTLSPAVILRPSNNLQPKPVISENKGPSFPPTKSEKPAVPQVHTTEITPKPGVSLIDQLNETLRGSRSERQRIVAGVDRLVDYVKTLPLPANGRILNPQYQFTPEGGLAISAGVHAEKKTFFGTVNVDTTFDVELVNDSSGGVSVKNHHVGNLGIAELKRGEIEGYVANLNRIIKEKLTEKTPGWEVSGFQITQGKKLAFDFKKVKNT